MTERYILDIPTLLNQLPKASYRALGDDFFVANLSYNESMNFMKYPVRFNGFLAFFCIEGRFTIDIDLHSYEVEEDSLIIYSPGNMVRVSSYDSKELSKLNFIIVASSESFITDVRVDFNRLYDDSLLALKNPCIRLAADERELLRKYYELTETLLFQDIPNNDKAVKYLGSSLFSLMGSIWKSRIDEAEGSARPRSIRANAVYENFLKLVSEHHSTQRDLKFYADKLCLTPKYLSKLIKGISGRTAAQWIDGFVILDAKNLLKYSDLSVKEIAFKMHFASVPSFYKFFNKEVGMTPMTYREQ
ncbi:MAG: helix-turn-helix domain-containing protein [Bacteroidales bacterium]|nr:helix-turn-helix domain-containing protein [Bacteroidales bacterium]